MHSLFSAEDLQQIREHDLQPDEIYAQLRSFESEFSSLKLDRPCTVGDGIQVLPQTELERLAVFYEPTKVQGRGIKFVPASGAANRMFALLFSSAKAPALVEELMRHLSKLAFYEELEALFQRRKKSLRSELEKKNYEEILHNILEKEGLGYAYLPKALLPFHRYSNECRTSLEEHLIEAKAYLEDREGRCRLHFTVSVEHRPKIEAYLQKILPHYEKHGIFYEIGLSVQSPHTDTLALAPLGEPFRDKQGRLVFWPAGHGALLENLQALGGEIIFIKNIDNVAWDPLQTRCAFYQKALAGYLLELQTKIFGYLRILAKKSFETSFVEEVLNFSQQYLSLYLPPVWGKKEMFEKAQFLFERLNRPLRVCGVVKNYGEPGGAPFWVKEKDDTLSLQFVEAAQLDPNSVEQLQVFGASTHFNPVVLVCGVRDYQSMPFPLLRFADAEACLITQKSYQGLALKIRERPGLWNGSMAHWNTVFVEIPTFCFTPVKTINDLLRPEHQAPGEV